MSKRTAQINVRMSPELHKVLLSIEEKHGITPPEIARRCLEQIADFYNVYGWFGFPMEIRPPEEMLKQIMASHPGLIFDPAKPKAESLLSKGKAKKGTIFFK